MNKLVCVFLLMIFNMSYWQLLAQDGANMTPLQENPQCKSLKDELLVHGDTVLNYTFRDRYQCQVHLLFPHSVWKGNLWLLHGWDLPAMEWCNKTTLCNQALEEGYLLIIPDLDRCNYPLKIYPETMEKYRKYPTLNWILDTLIPSLNRSTGILDHGRMNVIAGISTGGRGSTLMAFYRPDLFDACASLSGDFDITAMTDTYIYRGWFGAYNNFPDRWKDECIAYRTADYRVPTYIGHGKDDKVSPVTQSQALADSIRKNHPGLKIKGHFPENQGHDYTYWSSETKAILDFFEEVVFGSEP